MKTNILAVVSGLLLLAVSSCGPKCKMCHAEMMGFQTPKQEYCGDQLKQVEQSGTMSCE